VSLFKRKQPTIIKPDVDSLTLANLEKRGAILTNRRSIRHFLYGQNEAAMAPAITSLQDGGYSVDSRPAASGGNWLVLAEREEIVDQASVASARILFEHLARATLGGEYDGWEASIPEVGESD